MSEIQYPVQKQVICLLGKPSEFVRKFTLKPIVSGNYSLIIFPKKMLHSDYIKRYDFNYNNDPLPISFEYEFHEKLKLIDEWRWKLCYHYKKFAISETSPSLNITDNTSPTNSELIFNYSATALGDFNLYESKINRTHKIAVWSCNQPFMTSDSGTIKIEEDVINVFKWYAHIIENFNPDLIYGLGDMAYADGIDETNFIDEFYNHPQKLQSEDGQKELKKYYASMYDGHWSFADFQKIMRKYPHYCIWDDHEIRDGWGSENNDFEKGNATVFKVAHEVANEYILNQGPRVRPYKLYPNSDAHQSYFDGKIASFIFDGRSSRKYHNQKGAVISEEQFKDFENFCYYQVQKKQNVKYLLMACGVPFINLKDYIINLGSKTPKGLTDLFGGIRDDIRDSWNSPDNKDGLKKLLNVLLKLHRNRPDIKIVNISGDIHVANSFSFQPLGFVRPIYQITTSALTNREHPPEILSKLLYLGDYAFSDTLGFVRRIWTEVTDPNLLLISINNGQLEFNLKVFDLDYPNKETMPLDSVKDLKLKI
jgi:hypothetical protein